MMEAGRFHGTWPIQRSLRARFRASWTPPLHFVGDRSRAPYKRQEQATVLVARMPLFAIPFPSIDPVAVSLGPFAIRWYALAYIAGLLIGWRYCLALAGRSPRLVSPAGSRRFPGLGDARVVLGGRIGYVLFYQPGYYIHHPMKRCTYGMAACPSTAGRSA